MEGPVLDESIEVAAASQEEFDSDKGWTRIESTEFGGMLLELDATLERLSLLICQRNLEGSAMRPRLHSIGFTSSCAHGHYAMGPIRESCFSLNYGPLSMKNVAQARLIVSPTPMIPGYRAALTE